MVAPLLASRTGQGKLGRSFWSCGLVAPAFKVLLPCIHACMSLGSCIKQVSCDGAKAKPSCRLMPLQAPSPYPCCLRLLWGGPKQ